MARPIKTAITSAAYTTTETSASVDMGNVGGCQGILCILDLTAAGADGTDTLDVVIQGQLDGTNWIALATFAQIDGTGSTATQILKIGNTSVDVAEFDATANPAAGAARSMVATTLRAVGTIVSGSSASFTFSVVFAVM